MENGNSQAAPVATPPSPGVSAEELQAKIAELEKQSEGRLRDLQNERAKRQELEAQRNPAPVSSPVVQPDVTQDELGRVLKPYIDPMLKRVQAAESVIARTYEDKAMDHLASKTGKSKETLLQDKDFQDKLLRIVKRYGFAGNTYDITVKAYEILELEDLKVQDAERKRAAIAAAGSSLPAGNPAAPVVGAKEYSESEWAAIPLYEYEKLASQGDFHQNEAGKIVFTPRK